MSTTFDPIFPNITVDERQSAQEDFGRHVIEQRNRMAAIVQRWLAGEARFPVPLYDCLLDRLKGLDPVSRADVASVVLLMADQIVGAVLGTFDGSDDFRAGNRLVNYAIVAQIREPGSLEVSHQIDLNRGKPVLPVWDRYKRWLSRYAPTSLRANSNSADRRTEEVDGTGNGEPT